MATSDDAKAARSAFEAYASERGLNSFADWGLPEATQLLRHGFMQAVPNAATGRLAGLDDGWIAHASFSETSAGGIAEHMFTVVLVHVPASLGFAVRVLCHDRDLAASEISNPDADTEVVELDDRLVRVEPEPFFDRYRLSTDHDQDQLRVWQVFSPALIDWLVREAPPGFSFELQDGALCCFVPGVLETAAELAELSHATARLVDRIRELSEEAPSTAAAAPTRNAIVESELAAHPFERPPLSVFAAARRFGWWGLVTGRSWRLGTEAFFRAYAATIGFERIDEGAYRARHLDTPVPGEITQVARGRLARIGHDAYLILTKDERYSTSGWSVIVLDRERDANTFAFAGLAEEEAAKRQGIEITGTNDANIVWRPGPARKRTAAGLDEFIAEARKLLAATIAAGRPR